MNSYIRKTVLATALVFAAFCVQSCTKDGLTPEERLIERRERTFSDKNNIMSFYLNGNLVCDLTTWELCNKNWLVVLGRPQVEYHYYKTNEGEYILKVFANATTNHKWKLTNEDVYMGCISFDIPYEDDKFLLDSIKVKASFHKERDSFYGCPLSVSSMDFEIVEYDEENKCLMGRFSFNASYDFGAKEDWPESVEFSITDGMFCAYRY